MPSAIGHFIVGASLAMPFAFSSRMKETIRPLNLVIFTGLLSISPDIDTIFFGTIPYAHFLGHRGFFHSPLFLSSFALLIALQLGVLIRAVSTLQWLLLFVIFSLSMSAHSILDGMSDAGLGVMLLYPFSDDRIFLSWRPFYTPPIQVSALSPARIKMILVSEIYLIIGALSAGSCLAYLLHGLKIIKSEPGSDSQR